MKRGVWHQLGDKSQKVTLEQLEERNGVGAIISPKDLGFDKATEYAEQYRELGAEVLFDPQFYEPSFQNARFGSYELEDFRQSVSQLCKIGDQGIASLASCIEGINRQLKTNAVIAPACVYEAGRTDKIDLNAKLFGAAKTAAEVLGVPVYASIVLGSGITKSDVIANEILSQATSLQADGLYCAFELEEPPIPIDAEWVYRLGTIGLTLSSQGLPVLHAYAGLTGLLSFAFGADAVALGHTRNLRHFSLERWSEGPAQGGSGQPPPRYFSDQLWSTIVLPDETSRLPPESWKKIMSQSQHGPYSPTDGAWSRWASNKHLLAVVGRTLTAMSETQSAKANATAAIARLERAAQLHREIANIPMEVKDQANAYQANWARALKDLMSRNSADYDYLTFLGK